MVTIDDIEQVIKWNAEKIKSRHWNWFLKPQINKQKHAVYRLCVQGQACRQASVCFGSYHCIRHMVLDLHPAESETPAKGWYGSATHNQNRTFCNINKEVKLKTIFVFKWTKPQVSFKNHDSKNIFYRISH